MSPQKLIDRLAAMFPDFRRYWNNPENYFRNVDGSFTLHGVFAEFTSFFRHQHNEVTPDQIAALGTFVSNCMMQDEDSDLGNAAATCFVENIAVEDCDCELSAYLAGPAREYWMAWGGHETLPPHSEQ